MVAETDEIYREAVARYHRTLAHYFAVYAWGKNADCVCVTRSQLIQLLNLQKLTGKRTSWFEADVRPWFPQFRTMNEAKDLDKVHTVYLSRKAIPAKAMIGRMTSAERVASLRQNGLSAVRFLNGAAPPQAGVDERQLVGSMALLSAGITLLNALPGLGVETS